VLRQTGVKTRLLVADRLRSRFGIDRACVVADAGMIGAETRVVFEARGWNYIASRKGWFSIRCAKQTGPTRWDIQQMAGQGPQRDPQDPDIYLYIYQLSLIQCKWYQFCEVRWKSFTITTPMPCVGSSLFV
jgi:hypothetical protein